jgi:CTP synthase (UTP-ammonia lyase)
MKISEPIPHWNNFSVPELKEILEHCRALERLGIAQDEEMIRSIERDVTIREKKTISLHLPLESKHVIKQQTAKQNLAKANKKQPQEIVLEQTA